MYILVLKGIIFLVASAVIVYLSWESLHNPRSHGFYRFFAWEALAALILVNVDYWIMAPFSANQIASWLLLLFSLYLVVEGMRLLRIIGRPDTTRDDAELIGLEKTTQLVTVGMYKYIRHPLYSSLLFLAWGVFFKRPSWLGFGLAMISTAFLVATSKVEEGENIRFFGSAYEDYRKITKMFVPFLF